MRIHIGGQYVLGGQSQQHNYVLAVTEDAEVFPLLSLLYTAAKKGIVSRA